MAGTYTETDLTVFGNKKVKLFTVTNFTNNEVLTVSGFKKIDIAIPVVNVASASVGMTLSNNAITFKTAADSYDGQLLVIGH